MGLFSSVYHTHSHTETEVPYEKTVIEKRAPTDDSIRLADEYLEKAKKQVMSVFKLEPNALEPGVHGNIFMFNENFLDGGIQYIVQFNLNGAPFEFEFKLDHFEVRNLRLLNNVEADRKIFEKVYETISKKIALELIRSTGTKAIALKEDYKI